MVWELPTLPKTASVNTAADLAPKVPVSVIYGEDHSRPEQKRHGNAVADEGRKGDLIASNWARGIAGLLGERHCRPRSRPSAKTFTITTLAFIGVMLPFVALQILGV